MDAATLIPALGLGFSVFLCFSVLFCEVAEALDELFGEEGLVLVESVLLASEGSGLDVLYFESDASSWDGGDVDVKIVPHKFIITVLRPHCTTDSSTACLVLRLNQDKLNQSNQSNQSNPP